MSVVSVLKAAVIAAALVMAMNGGQSVGERGREVEVELELVLAVDTSASIDPNAFALQTAGLADAFRSPSVIAAIHGVGPNGIAVSLVQWGVGLQQHVAVDWHHVHDGSSAEALARAIEASPRHFVGNGTDITRALWFCAELFRDKRYSGRRRVIDLSGDGRNNASGGPGRMRDKIVARGIVVNGLAILDGDLLLGRYFENNVAGRTASFVMTVNSFADYAVAIEAKLLREILAPIAAAPRDPRRSVTGLL